jgi:hypothetical protein
MSGVSETVRALIMPRTEIRYLRPAYHIQCGTRYQLFCFVQGKIYPTVSQNSLLVDPFLASKNNHKSSLPCSRKYSVQLIGLQNYEFMSHI